MANDHDHTSPSIIRRQIAARSLALSGSGPKLTIDDVGREQRTGMTVDVVNATDIVAIAESAAASGRRVRLTTADGVHHEGIAGRAQGSSAGQFGLRDAGGLIRCFSTSPKMGDDRRVIDIEVLPDAQASEWIEVTSIEQARALNGKMVEVDATHVPRGGWMAVAIHGHTITATLRKSAIDKWVLASSDDAVLWNESGVFPEGLRLRVVEAKPRIIGGVTFSCPTQVPVSVMISGYKVDLVACQRALFGWVMSLSPGVDVDADQIKAAVQSTMENAIVAVSKDGETWLRSVAITAREVASISLDRVKIFDHERRDSMVVAVLEQGESMRPELAAAIARQEHAEQPPQSVTCPRCKGHGTELLVSPCPQCSGTGSLAVAGDRRYSYELRETFRDGDQVWEIKYGDSLGSTVAGFIITTLSTVKQGQHAGAMTTEVQECTSTGVKRVSPLLGDRTEAGTFVGEHHGERAASGYVDYLNATAGR